MSAIHQIRMSGGGDILRLDAANVDDFVVGGPSTSRWRLHTDGGVYQSRAGFSGGAFIRQYDWVIPNSSAPNYECTWDVGTNVVDVTPGAAGTYLALTVNRTWEETNPSAFEDCTFTARIRRVGASTDAKTALIGLSVDGSP